MICLKRPNGENIYLYRFSSEENFDILQSDKLVTEDEINTVLSKCTKDLANWYSVYDRLIETDIEEQDLDKHFDLKPDWRQYLLNDLGLKPVRFDFTSYIPGGG